MPDNVKPDKAALIRRSIEVAKEEGLDQDTALLLPAILGQESDFGQNTLGPDTGKGRGRAKGAFQFIDSTWKKYAPTPDADPFDFESSAKAAARYLKDLHKETGGDYRKMVASYYGADTDGYADSVLGTVDKIRDKAGRYYQNYQGQGGSTQASAPLPKLAEILGQAEPQKKEGEKIKLEDTYSSSLRTPTPQEDLYKAPGKTFAQQFYRTGNAVGNAVTAAGQAPAIGNDGKPIANSGTSLYREGQQKTGFDADVIASQILFSKPGDKMAKGFDAEKKVVYRIPVDRLDLDQVLKAKDRPKEFTYQYFKNLGLQPKETDELLEATGWKLDNPAELQRQLQQYENNLLLMNDPANAGKQMQPAVVPGDVNAFTAALAQAYKDGGVEAAKQTNIRLKNLKSQYEQTLTEITDKDRAKYGPLGGKLGLGVDKQLMAAKLGAYEFTREGLHFFDNIGLLKATNAIDHVMGKESLLDSLKKMDEGFAKNQVAIKQVMDSMSTGESFINQGVAMSGMILRMMAATAAMAPASAAAGASIRTAAEAGKLGATLQGIAATTKAATWAGAAGSASAYGYQQLDTLFSNFHKSPEELGHAMVVSSVLGAIPWASKGALAITAKATGKAGLTPFVVQAVSKLIPPAKAYTISEHTLSILGGAGAGYGIALANGSTEQQARAMALLGLAQPVAVYMGAGMAKAISNRTGASVNGIVTIDPKTLPLEIQMKMAEIIASGEDHPLVSNIINIETRVRAEKLGLNADAIKAAFDQIRLVSDKRVQAGGSAMPVPPELATQYRKVLEINAGLKAEYALNGTAVLGTASFGTEPPIDLVAERAKAAPVASMTGKLIEDIKVIAPEIAIEPARGGGISIGIEEAKSLANKMLAGSVDDAGIDFAHDVLNQVDKAERNGFNRIGLIDVEAKNAGTKVVHEQYHAHQENAYTRKKQQAADEAKEVLQSQELSEKLTSNHGEARGRQIQESIARSVKQVVPESTDSPALVDIGGKKVQKQRAIFDPSARNQVLSDLMGSSSKAAQVVEKVSGALKAIGYMSDANTAPIERLYETIPNLMDKDFLKIAGVSGKEAEALIIAELRGLNLDSQEVQKLAQHLPKNEREAFNRYLENRITDEYKGITSEQTAEPSKTSSNIAYQGGSSSQKPVQSDVPRTEPSTTPSKPQESAAKPSSEPRQQGSGEGSGLPVPEASKTNSEVAAPKLGEDWVDTYLSEKTSSGTKSGDMLKQPTENQYARKYLLDYAEEAAKEKPNEAKLNSIARVLGQRWFIDPQEFFNVVKDGPEVAQIRAAERAETIAKHRAEQEARGEEIRQRDAEYNAQREEAISAKEAQKQEKVAKKQEVESAKQARKKQAAEKSKERVEAQKQKEVRAAEEKKNKVLGGEVAKGDRVYHPSSGKYGTVSEVRDASVKLTFDDGTYTNASYPSLRKRNLDVPDIVEEPLADMDAEVGDELAPASVDVERLPKLDTKQQKKVEYLEKRKEAKVPNSLTPEIKGLRRQFREGELQPGEKVKLSNGLTVTMPREPLSEIYPNTKKAKGEKLVGKESEPYTPKGDQSETPYGITAKQTSAYIAKHKHIQEGFAARYGLSGEGRALQKKIHEAIVYHYNNPKLQAKAVGQAIEGGVELPKDYTGLASIPSSDLYKFAKTRNLVDLFPPELMKIGEEVARQKKGSDVISLYSRDLSKTAGNTAKSRTSESRAVKDIFSGEDRPKGRILHQGAGLKNNPDRAALRELGDVVDYDPNHSPETGKLLGKGDFDSLVNPYVLNVLPPNIRKQAILEGAKSLKPDGKAYIAVRGAADINQERKPTWESYEDGYLVPNKGEKNFQRGFTPEELVQELSPYYGKIEIMTRGKSVMVKASEPKVNSSASNGTISLYSREVTKPDPRLEGKEVIGTLEDGRVVVQNKNNKGAISILKDRSVVEGAAGDPTIPLYARGIQDITPHLNKSMSEIDKFRGFDYAERAKMRTLSRAISAAQAANDHKAYAKAVHDFETQKGELWNKHRATISKVSTGTASALRFLPLTRLTLRAKDVIGTLINVGVQTSANPARKLAAKVGDAFVEKAARAKAEKEGVAYVGVKDKNPYSEVIPDLHVQSLGPTAIKGLAKGLADFGQIASQGRSDFQITKGIHYQFENSMFLGDNAATKVANRAMAVVGNGFDAPAVRLAYEIMFNQFAEQHAGNLKGAAREKAIQDFKDNPSETAMIVSRAFAEQATYNNPNELARFAAGIVEQAKTIDPKLGALAEVGMGVYAKYLKVPHNVWTQRARIAPTPLAPAMFLYDIAALHKTLIDGYDPKTGKFNIDPDIRYSRIHKLTESTAGTALTAALATGTLLFSNYLYNLYAKNISGGYDEKQEKEMNKDEARGLDPGALRIPGTRKTVGQYTLGAGQTLLSDQRHFLNTAVAPEYNTKTGEYEEPEGVGWGLLKNTGYVGMGHPIPSMADKVVKMMTGDADASKGELSLNQVGLLRDIKPMIDPYKRQTERGDYKGSMRNSIGLGKDLPAKIDVTGQPIKERTLIGDYKTSPGLDEATRLGVHLPKHQVQQKGSKNTPTELEGKAIYSGQAIDKAISALVERADYKALSNDEKKAKLLADVVDVANTNPDFSTSEILHNGKVKLFISSVMDKLEKDSRYLRLSGSQKQKAETALRAKFNDLLVTNKSKQSDVSLYDLRDRFRDEARDAGVIKDTILETIENIKETTKPALYERKRLLTDQ